MKRRVLAPFVGAGIAAIVTAAAADSGSSGPSLTNVPAPNPKAAGYAPAPRLSPELRQLIQAQGSTALENPAGIVGWYGYENDTPSPDDAVRDRGPEARRPPAGADGLPPPLRHRAAAE